MSVARFMQYIAYSDSCPRDVSPQRWKGMLLWWEQISVAKLFGGTMTQSEHDTLHALDALMPFHSTMWAAHQRGDGACVNPIAVSKGWLMRGFLTGLITGQEAVCLGRLAGIR